ncbi:UDP-GlcNAc3NAcA epimerase [Flavobacterium arsenatis]|uniref:UDP-GlcNAc3NAcA epimerase n=1 Tax=Flavobacterium arsenatis TaxID=1484332 RepID=A0ABU1TPK8_9FLAO|nr:UDP-N-acetylglucosamine 2-epimerase (non-hydrolyzing) [Flavobacterium arsenatis]MDR6967866.1 UDP-GlcNAc3NAcA epimerase [Flavobacterium arsenatis]
MIKILTIIGARPQIIKAAAISRSIKNKFQTKIKEVIVHTGQHYDANMSEVFFEELQIPKPDYNLNIGSGKHGNQTGKMISGIEEILETEKPNFMVIYGDTNSTLAGAISASKMHVQVVHIEAGLRSFNKSMPEEINRIVSDHVSTYLFPPTQTGVDNLKREGFNLESNPPFTIDNPGIFNLGDVMLDNSLYFSEIAESSNVLEILDLEKNKYVLATIHRNNNTDDKERLKQIFKSLHHISRQENVKIVLPLHPRTLKQRKVLLDESFSKELDENKNLIIIEPVSFLEMIALEKNAKLIITDSGGVQKEAFFFSKPCIILRQETEWVEIVESGAARLCDANFEMIIESYYWFDKNQNIQAANLYGDGTAAEKILQLLLND